jgi:hypothetical protein
MIKNPNNRLRVVVTIAVLAVLMAISTIGQAKGKLASKQYLDPKGYFRIVPPDGWRVQEYPSDPRGKVAIMGPEGNVDLRVLTNAVDFSTVDELVTYCQGIESRTGLSTNIERIEFGGRPAVKRTFEMKGLKFHAIDFLVGTVDHNLMYGAPAATYPTYLPLAQASMETYEAAARDTTAKDVASHAVAKKLRLAQLMVDQGNFELALMYIQEGLEFSPQDANLLDLKRQIEKKLNQ